MGAFEYHHQDKDDSRDLSQVYRPDPGPTDPGIPGPGFLLAVSEYQEGVSGAGPGGRRECSAVCTGAQGKYRRRKRSEKNGNPGPFARFIDS